MKNGCSDKLSETTFKGKFWKVKKSTRTLGEPGQIGIALRIMLSTLKYSM